MKMILMLLLALAVVHDLRETRVPNYLTVGGAIVALGLSAYQGGAGAAGLAAAAMLLGAAAFVPFFALRMVGAGDVKLFGMVGGFVGLDALLPVGIYVALAGGVLGLAAMVQTQSLSEFLANMKWFLLSVARREPESEAAQESVVRTSARIPYALAIAAGTLIWMMGQS